MEKAEALCMVCAKVFDIDAAEVLNANNDRQQVWVRCPNCRTQIMLAFADREVIQQLLCKMEKEPK